MQRTSRLFIALAALLCAMGASTAAHAVARWQNFAADPAYKTRAEAIADAPRVMRAQGYPEEVIARLTQEMKKPGKKVRLENGNKLDWMRTGQGKKRATWKNVLVDFKRPARGMGYHAEAEEWSVTWNGRVYTIGIPEVCNNLYGLVAAYCVYVDAEVRELTERQLKFRTSEVKDDDCWGFRRVSALHEPDGPDAVWQKPEEGCLGAWCTFDGAERLVSTAASQQGSIPVTPGHYQFRLSPGEWLMLCLENADLLNPSSYTAVVKWRESYGEVGGTTRARVYYQSNEVPAAYALGHPKALMFWSHSEEHWALVQRHFAQNFR